MSLQKKIPEGKFQRSSIVGITTAKAGIRKISYLTRVPFLKGEERDTLSQKNDEEIAKIIFKALSNLRGTALKAAQMLSMEIELLPEAYRKELLKAANNVPPINRALIRKIITNQLGAPPEQLFKSFDSMPFAAASLGQVYNAISKDGHALAVKVQYPGISASVKSDIDMLKTLVRPTKYFKIFKNCFNEIQKKIEEELDYVKEAENTNWFYNNVKFKNIIIPRIFPELSSSKVLTTSLIEGVHLDKYLKTNPSQKAKNQYGQLLVNLFNYTSMNLMKIHADPNLGNYIFMDDGKLGIIDFGCVKKLTKEMVKGIISSYEPDIEKDNEKLKTFYKRIGLIFKKDFEDKKFGQFIQRWAKWITRPQRETAFAFNEGSQYFNDGMELIKDFYKYVDHFEGEFMYYGRSFYGLQRVLQSLSATVDMTL